MINKFRENYNTTSKQNNVSNNETSIISKLKRLKMQEVHLTKNIKKNMEAIELNTQRDSEETKRSILLAEISKDITHVITLFRDIKDNANSEETDNIDIDQIKRDILTIENKITGLKHILNEQMSNLTDIEEKLMKEISDQTAETHKLGKKTKQKITSFNDIVPSPVKAIINTPYKHKSVQKLYDFFTATGGKYGGWQEHNHSLFMRVREKYMQGLQKEGRTYDIDSKRYNMALQLIKDVLLKKIPGISEEKIYEHEKWYLKLIPLKSDQQDALDKWKETRNCNKTRACKVKNDSFQAVNRKSREDNEYLATLHSAEENYVQLIPQTPQQQEVGKYCFGSPDDVSSVDKYIVDIMSNRMLHNSQRKTITNNKTNTHKNLNSVISNYHFIKSTEGWHNKCLEKKRSPSEISYTNGLIVDNIKKIGIPKWRQLLNEK